MPRNPSPEPVRLEDGWHGIVVGAGVLALAELCRAKIGVGASAFGRLGTIGSVLTVFLALIVAVSLHHGIVWSLAFAGLSRLRARRVVWLGSTALAALYGWAWQATVSGGDGISASRWGNVVRPLLGVGTPLGLAILAGALFWPGRIPPLARTLALSALLVAGLVVTLGVLPDYRAFHGFLAGFEATLVALLVAGRRWTKWASFAVLGLSLVATALLLPRAFVAQAYARRFTLLPGAMLEALPLTRAMLPTVAPFVDPDSRQVAPRKRPPELEAPLSARGDSVLLVVLEATRSDAWADPAVAPEFARYRSHGLYVPRAVSQYPATPLAYGAMFTSHPPSVVMQSPHWTKHRLFDLIAPGFKSVFLSQPAERWFDTGAVTSFITASAPIRRHADTHQGIADLRRFLDGEAGRAPFFAWIHLFDPHRPHDARGGVSQKAPRAVRYRSEVKAMDAELGEFMRWFYAQPFAARTLAMILGDHGEALGEVIGGEKHLGHHVHVTDIIAHVPFYASGPGLPTDVVKKDLGVCQLDVMPTIFDHLGVRLPARFHAQGMPLPKLLSEHPLRTLPTEAFSIRGREFFQFIGRAANSDARAQRRFFREMWEAGTYPPKLAIERGSWKLVRDAMIKDDALYDLAADPRETRNVAGARPAELEVMRSALEAWTDTQVNVLRELESTQ